MHTDIQRTVLITGFGPFGKHNVNASWEAVKELKKLTADLEKLHNINLVIKEIPVAYDNAIIEIPQLWKKYNPVIVIHVGVSHKAHCLTIESRAHSTGYIRSDICEKCPSETDVAQCVLETKIDGKSICDNVNENSHETGCKACISHDAGRYLCEYVYYQSLSMQTSQTIFIHVPDFDVYSSTQTAKGLYIILRYLIEHLEYS